MPGGAGLLHRRPGPAARGGFSGQQPPAAAPGLQPTFCAPRWVILALDKVFPASVLWSACQLRVAILVGAMGEGAMLLNPPDILISYVFVVSFFSLLRKQH